MGVSTHCWLVPELQLPEFAAAPLTVLAFQTSAHLALLRFMRWLFAEPSGAARTGHPPAKVT
jgi:hypothetical protein